ncbi:MAG: glutamate--tRNA ligase [Thermoplasmata archaeon]
MSLRLLARKYALQNAHLFGGRADVKAVMGKMIAEDPSLKSRASEVLEVARDVVKEVNTLPPERQREELAEIDPSLLKREKKERVTELPELTNVENGVVMRLAPYPSGALHIGHSRMALLNDEYVKRYDGKLLLVFDDTIGSEEKVPVAEAYDLIREGLDWLGVNCHEVVYKSDRMHLFYEWGERLLKDGHAYVCECPAETLRALRENGEECEHRNSTTDDNVEKWFKMLNGYYGEGEAVVRLKTDMKHPNPAFRDRVLFRIRDRVHPRTGDKLRVWPLLEFSWAVDDHLLGVTHILRGKDLVIEDEMEKYLWDLFDLPHKEFVHYGMLRLKEMKLSKSRMSREIEKGVYTGVDDPRTWTLQSLMKRGIDPQAVRSFILGFGVSLTDVEVAAENLYAENRKMIDERADRYFFVPDPVKIHLVGKPEDLRVAQAPFHPDFGERGSRPLDVSRDIVFVAKDDLDANVGKEVRLKDFCNVVLGEEAEFVSAEVKDIPKIQWSDAEVPVKVIMSDGSILEGYGESTLQNAKPGDIVQFERIGFARIDKVVGGITAYFAHR